jgi:pimeloyl-ACP methyl ester carboxylesterase
MPEVELSAGPISYEDSRGDGPTVVLCHGLLMDGALWDEVVAELGPSFRCLLPTLPMGAHRMPMYPEADLSLHGQVRLLVEFLDRLELEDVTLVFNDWCGAQILIAEGWDERVARIVFASCETYDNYPPGIPGKVAALSASLPRGISGLKLLRFRPFRRLPLPSAACRSARCPMPSSSGGWSRSGGNRRSAPICASTPGTPQPGAPSSSRRIQASGASKSRS